MTTTPANVTPAPELLPCPGGCSVDLLSIYRMNLGRNVYCACGWAGPQAESLDAAIAAWNRRAGAGA